MANTITMEFRVTDKGTLKMVGQGATKASKNLDKVSSSSRGADRNIKGVANASSNATKNFSKMAQGMAGSIVPAYAAFAAQVFAIGAAFRFLQDAGDLAALQKGQQAYAAATGVALRSIANDIIEASEAQITFRDASQAAAIGVAAGLSPDQLTRLGKAAKDVSIVLGRDVTDSFNRLVRGVTKAEPELLDELGVILRLENATQRYADAIGKNRQELTQFERSQAVANDVLAQTEQKYSEVLDIIDPSVNQYRKFAKAFDDLVNTLKKFVDSFAAPIMGFLAENPFATLLISARLLNGILETMGVGAANVAAKFSEGMTALAVGAKKAGSSAQKDLAFIQAFRGDTETATKVTKVLEEEILDLGKSSGVSFLGMKKLGEGGSLAAQTITKNLKDATNGTGAFANASKKTRKQFIEMFTDLQQLNRISTGKLTAGAAAVEARWVAMFAKIKATAASSMAKVVTIFQTGVTKIGKLLSKLATPVGIALLAFDFLPESTKEWIKEGLGIRTLDAETSEYVTTLKDLNVQYEKFIEIQKKLVEARLGEETPFTSTIETLASIQEVINSISILSESSALSNIMATGGDVGFLEGLGLGEVDDLLSGQAKRFKLISDSLEEFGIASTEAGDRYKTLLDNFLREQDGKITLNTAFINEDSIKSLGAARSEIEKILNNAKILAQTSKTLNETLPQAFNDLIGTATPLDSLVSTLEQSVKAAAELEKNQIKGLNKGLTDRYKLETELLNIFKKQRDILRQQKTFSEQINAIRARFAVGATKDQTARFNQLLEIVKLERSLSDIRTTAENVVEASIAQNRKELTDIEKERLRVLFNQEEALVAQLHLLQIQQDAGYRLGQSVKEGFERGFQTNIYDLITGEETDLKMIAANIAKATLESAASELSKIITENVMDLFNVQTEEERQKELYRQIFDEGANKFGSVIQAKLDEASKKVSDSFDNSKTVKVLAEEKDVTLTKGKPITLSGGQVLSSVYDGPTNSLRVKVINGEPPSGITLPQDPGAAEEKMVPQDFPEDPKSFDFLGKALGDHSATMEEVLSEDAPFLNGLAGVFNSGLSGFGSILSGILGGGRSGGGGIIGTIASVAASAFTGAPVARYGGVMKAYSDGGIAKGTNAGYPAILHGTEAVVPLPNGKSIPVEMRDAATNNVTVNVSVDNSGNAQTQTQMDNQQAGNLGKVISLAVQEELQRQKRPGGILSPYGAA